MNILFKYSAVVVSLLLGGTQMATAQLSQNVEFATNKGSGSGFMNSSEFKAQKGLAAILEDFEFDFKWLVTEYKMYYLPKGNDVAEEVKGNGTLFSSTAAVKNLIDKAKPGDRYIFENIMLKGSNGEKRPSKGSLSVIIK